MIKGIIFDFDGVIVDSVQVKTDAFAVLYKPYGPNIVKKVVEHHEANGGMSRFEKIRLYHESFLNKTISEGGIMNFAGQFSELVVKKVIEAPYVPGALEYIKSEYSNKKLFISTGTPSDEIFRIVKAKNIGHYFVEILGSPDIKMEHLKFIMSKYELNADELIFFGDSSTDINAASAFNIPFILIKNSHNYNAFESYNGDYIKNFFDYKC